MSDKGRDGGKSLACVILQNKYEKAVTETEGKVIVWNKELKLVPYHELSAGQTKRWNGSFPQRR